MGGVIIIEEGRRDRIFVGKLNRVDHEDDETNQQRCTNMPIPLSLSVIKHGQSSFYFYLIT